MKLFFRKYWWMVLPLLLAVLFILNISIGSVKIPVSQILTILTGGEPTSIIWTDIILDLRLTKALTCILAGSALALGGLLMQTLFRNPLAGPDVLGLSSGASLAVAILVMTGGGASVLFSSSFAIAFTASIGCLGVFILVLIIAQHIKDNTSLLLIGLMIGAVTSSIVSVLQFVSRSEDQQYYLIWTFGSLGSLNWAELQVLAIAVGLGIILSFASIKSLNGWLLGDNYAKSMGVNLNRSRLLVIICTSLLTGAVTAFCGPIAFIGLAIPHLTRLLIDTTTHKILIPASMLLGAIILLFCDIVSQLPGTNFIIPINAITALIGAPVVIWIILKSKKVRI
jgi:iron complex transport system permease protein